MSLKIFISHATKDQDLALEIRARLVKDGHKVFVANADVLPGQDCAREISEALSRSQAMAVLLSPEAVESRNVLHEISYALGSTRYEGRVLPVLVRPTENISWFLQTIMRIDVSNLSLQSPRIESQALFINSAGRRVDRSASVAPIRDLSLAFQCELEDRREVVPRAAAACRRFLVQQTQYCRRATVA